MNLKKFTGLTIAMALCLSLVAFTGADAIDTIDEIPAEENLMPEDAELISTEEILNLDDQIQEDSVVELAVQEASLDSEVRAMANIADVSDVYVDPTTESETAGQIFSNTSVSVLEKNQDWAKIATGNLVGYVPCHTLMFGRNGDVLMNAKCGKIAEVIPEETPLYIEPCYDAEVIDVGLAGEVYGVTRILAGWYGITNGETEFFIPSSEVSVSLELQDGKTSEEMEAEAAELAALLEQMQYGSYEEQVYASSVFNTRYANSYALYRTIKMSDYERELLTRVVYLEAGDDYEEALKVVNVVYNRVLDGNWGGSTVYDVLTASGQFSTIGRAMAGMGSDDTGNISAAIDAASNGENLVGTASTFHGNEYTNWFFGSVDVDWDNVPEEYRDGYVPPEETALSQDGAQ